MVERLVILETVCHVCIICQNAVTMQIMTLILRLPIGVVLSSLQTEVAVCFSGVIYGKGQKLNQSAHPLTWKLCSFLESADALKVCSSKLEDMVGR